MYTSKAQHLRRVLQQECSHAAHDINWHQRWLCPVQLLNQSQLVHAFEAKADNVWQPLAFLQLARPCWQFRAGLQEAQGDLYRHTIGPTFLTNQATRTDLPHLGDDLKVVERLLTAPVRPSDVARLSATSHPPFSMQTCDVHSSCNVLCKIALQACMCLAQHWQSTDGLQHVLWCLGMPGYMQDPRSQESAFISSTA